MDFLDFVPESIFETVGTVAGLAACFFVATQMVKEWRDTTPSTLTRTYVIGWLLVFIFWMLYGFRFRAIALWLTNSIAICLQTGLLIATERKRKKI